VRLIQGVLARSRLLEIGSNRDLERENAHVCTDLAWSEFLRILGAQNCTRNQAVRRHGLTDS